MSLSTLRRFVLALSLAAVTGFSLAPVRGNAEEKPVVHLVAIGDLDVDEGVPEKDKYFGKKVAEDARHIVATFEQAFAKAGKADQLKTKLLIGKDVTPDKVLQTINKLEVRPNDTIVVLYSGHGAMTPFYDHIFTFHHGNLARKDVIAAMKAKNPRLMVVLADCCSSGVEARHVVPKVEPKKMTDGNVMEWSTINSLFLRHSGLVDISAAEPGFCGRLDNDKAGSLFTNALVRILKTPNGELVRHLDKNGDGHLQWHEVLPQVRGLAAQYHRQQTGSDRQQAYATSLGQWLPVNVQGPR